MVEFVILVAFIGLQGVAKCAPMVATKVAHWVIIQKLSQHHYLVWIGHPVFWHGLYDYVVHAVIYSGYIIHH